MERCERGADLRQPVLPTSQGGEAGAEIGGRGQREDGPCVEARQATTLADQGGDT